MKRPDTLDLEVLIKIVNELDTASENSLIDVDDLLKVYLDPDSAAYMSVQRALRMENLKSRNKMPSFVPLAGMWLDGLLAGLKFNATKTTMEKTDEP